MSKNRTVELTGNGQEIKLGIRWQSSTEEWTVRVWIDGKFSEAKTYYTDAREDAESTMDHMILTYTGQGFTYKTPSTIEQANTDPFRDDIKVQWAGDNVILLHPDTRKPLTVLGTSDAVGKITRWCLKNNYRCTQIRDGKIML